ncbi:methyltransferase domain-containing protein [Streptomyces sp. NPDC006356]
MSDGNLLTDHPALHEARFPDTDRLAGRWTEDCLRRYDAGPRVLDMGCGTGRDAAHLHSAGRTVTGADLSEAILSYARARHPGPSYVHADLHGFDLGAFDGRTDLLDSPKADSFTWQGTAYRSRTTLTAYRTAQLLRRTRVWTADDGSPPLEQRSAWRLLFPQELRRFLAAHGFDVLELHDGPGPRTEPLWREGESPGTTTDADRLHLVARLHTL